MRARDFVITAALTAAMSAPALAQTAPADETHRGWVASVLFGTNFQASTDRESPLGILDIAGDTDSQGAASFAFSGQIGYMWENVGLEGLFDFTPSVDVTRAEFSEPSANSYMVNLITAIPFGPEGRFQPVRVRRCGCGVAEHRPAGSSFSQESSRP